MSHQPADPGRAREEKWGRRTPGERIAPFRLETLSHGPIDLPGPGYVHLQLRRFAGCPICNLHMARFAKEHARLVAAGVRTVAVFHSPAEVMRPYQGDLPFAVVPDPERRWYRLFGAERSALASFHPRAMWSAMKGLASARASPLAGASDPSQLPADVLLDRHGTIVDVHYGAHADDQWSVDELLARCA